MKVAITFFGFMRNFRENAPYWKYLIDTYNADIFIHTWDTEEYHDATINQSIDSVQAGHSGQKDSYELLNVDDVYALYSPKLFVADTYREHHPTFVEHTKWMEDARVELLRNHPEEFWHAYPRFVSMVSMHYKWWKVSQLKQRYELDNNFLYDVVLHARTDFRPDSSFVLNETNSIVTGPWPSGPPQPWVDYKKGISDFWMYGPSKTMDMLCSIYPRLNKIWEFCLNTDGYGFYEATNVHTVPVTNLMLHLSDGIVKLDSQHGEKI